MEYELKTLWVPHSLGSYSAIFGADHTPHRQVEGLHLQPEKSIQKPNPHYKFIMSLQCKHCHHYRDGKLLVYALYWTTCCLKYQNSLDSKVNLVSHTIRVWTHLLLDKMAANLANDIFMCIVMNEKFDILIWISLKFVPKVPLYNKSAMVQVMACRLFGVKPLLEPLLTNFIDAYMRHLGEMS